MSGKTKLGIAACSLLLVVTVMWQQQKRRSPKYSAPIGAQAFSLHGSAAPLLTNGQVLTGVVHLVVAPVVKERWHSAVLGIDNDPIADAEFQPKATNVAVFKLDTRKYPQAEHLISLGGEVATSATSLEDWLYHWGCETKHLPRKTWKVRFANPQVAADTTPGPR